MPPQDQDKTSAAPAGENSAPAPQPDNKNNIDLSKILLPKKETPGQTPASASRINAGALLEQETHAAQEGLPPRGQALPKAAPLMPKPLEAAPAQQLTAPTTPELSVELPPTPPQTPQPAPEPAAPAPKKEEPAIAPLETYKGDIERVVQEKNISMVAIAAAEAERRGSQAATVGDAAGEKRAWFRSSLMVSAGLTLIAVALGVLAFVFYLRTAPLPPQAQQVPASTIISTDGAQTVVMQPGESRDTLVTNLTAAKVQTALPLGLISRLWVAVPTSTQNGNTLEEVDAQTLMTTLAPNMPQALLRTLLPNYLLGVEVYDGNQAFFIFKVDSYEQAYAGMLQWEPYMQQDLLPLFAYTPPPHIPEQGTATTSATTSPVALTGQGSPFVDQIVENHDARVIEDQYGNITMLWTFLDKQTLVVATTDATLREIILRMSQAPVVPQP